MLQLTLITVGTLKEQYLLDAAQEYKKRLSQYAKVEDIVIKEERIRDEDNRAEIDSALASEGERILSRIPNGAYTVALCVEGKQFSSPSLAKKLLDETTNQGKLCLIIGSSHGLAGKVKEAADLRLSVSELTFPHQLMRVMLLEIIYRSLTIIHGKKYHK